MVAQLTYLTVMLSYCMLTEHKEKKHHSVVEVNVEKSRGQSKGKEKPEDKEIAVFKIAGYDI